MKTPTIREYDGWRATATAQWFFEVYLQGYADVMAGENGRAAGAFEDTEGKAFMTFAKNAGVIQGVEDAISLDPFAEEREELKDEDTSSGETSPS